MNRSDAVKPSRRRLSATTSRPLPILRATQVSIRSAHRRSISMVHSAARAPRAAMPVKAGAMMAPTTPTVTGISRTVWPSSPLTMIRRTLPSRMSSLPLSRSPSLVTRNFSFDSFVSIVICVHPSLDEIPARSHGSALREEAELGRDPQIVVVQVVDDDLAVAHPHVLHAPALDPLAGGRGLGAVRQGERRGVGSSEDPLVRERVALLDEALHRPLDVREPVQLLGETVADRVPALEDALGHELDGVLGVQLHDAP